MVITKIEVTGQEMRVISNFTGMADHSQKFVKFEFDLKSDWNGLTIFAQFIQNGHAYNTYLDQSNSAYLPSEIKEGLYYLTLYGTGTGDVIGTTKALKLYLDPSHFVADAQSTVISTSLYQQLVDTVNNYKADMNDRLVDAVDDLEDEIGDVRSDLTGEITTAVAEFTAMVGTPLTASTVAAMTDHSKIYVYTGSQSGYTNGHWYYWNGSAWTDGGVYNAGVADSSTSTTSTNAVQNKAITIEMRLLADDIPNTTRSITFNSDSSIVVTHKSGNTPIRTDTYTFGNNTITEKRALHGTGLTLNIVTDLDTLDSVLTYTRVA